MGSYSFAVTAGQEIRQAKRPHPISGTAYINLTLCLLRVGRRPKIGCHISLEISPNILKSMLKFSYANTFLGLILTFIYVKWRF